MTFGFHYPSNIYIYIYIYTLLYIIYKYIYISRSISDTSDVKDIDQMAEVDEENLSERRPQITKLDNRPKLQVVEANDPSPTNLFFQVGKEPAILPQPLLPIHPPDGAEQINWETGSGFWDADTADNDAMKALLSKPAALFSDSGNEITLSTTPTYVKKNIYDVCK